MSITTVLPYVQIGSAILLMVTILLQRRGDGLGGGIGGSGMEYSTKRGVEKGVFITSIVLTVLFVASSILRLIL